MAIIKHRKSAIPNKVPATSGMTFGEIFVNYASGDGKSFLILEALTHDYIYCIYLFFRKPADVKAEQAEGLTIPKFREEPACVLIQFPGAGRRIGQHTLMGRSNKPGILHSD